MTTDTRNTDSARSWKEELAGRLPGVLDREIDVFDLQIQLRRQGRVDERLFAETRLRRGVYGQRYDNGQRHDGVDTRTLPYEDKPTKGPDTIWDAPGMVRIKIPWGRMTIDQMEILAEVAEDYSDGILHVTTRQDFQLHFVHINDTPDLMRRLAAVGITTREACGNSVRNVTACPISGVCHTEEFDVSPYAEALKEFLLGHPDVQDFGRKFKIAFSGCRHEACGLTSMHDLGLIATTRVVDGERRRGFEFYVGGGLGANPHQAKLLEEFVTEQELLPLTQAVSRIFARYGEKENRGRARIKFLVAKVGIDEFRRLVLEERETLPHDPRWTAFLDELDSYGEAPLREAEPLGPADESPAEGFGEWRATNVRTQKQDGYYVVTVALPLGDLTSGQMRALADVAGRFVGDNLRTTVEQNIVLRWVSEVDLPELYAALRAVDLADAGAGTIADVTACPGTDTCKLGIASARGLAAELRSGLVSANGDVDPAVKGLRIKASGCFNSCGQHHAADLGFYGISRKKDGRLVPHFQVVLGGQWTENAGSYGMATLAIPSKRIPEVVRRITGRYVKEHEPEETFQEFIRRVGKAQIKEYLQDLTTVPSYAEDPSFYSDWGDPREYTMDDYGVGECAGEIVPLVEFGLQASEREVFEAQLRLDMGDAGAACDTAYEAMLTAAKALVKTEFLDITDDPDRIVNEFRARFHETKRFHDRFAGAKFARYLFHAHEEALDAPDLDQARARVEEAQLFIEAAYACYERTGSAAPVETTVGGAS